MSVEEIRKAKLEAEQRIQQIVHELQVNTGLVLGSVDVRHTTTEFVLGGKRIWVEVEIDLLVA